MRGTLPNPRQNGMDWTSYNGSRVTKVLRMLLLPFDRTQAIIYNQPSVASLLTLQMTSLLRWLLVLSVGKRQVFRLSILESRNVKCLLPFCKTVSLRSIPLDCGHGKPWHSSVHVARLGSTQLLRAFSAEKDLLHFLKHRAQLRGCSAFALTLG